MPTLVLSPRFTPDTIALAKAAEAAGWMVERLHEWCVPERLKVEDVAIYGGELFAAFVAQELERPLLTPPDDWLPNLPTAYRKREVELTSLQKARSLRHPTFVKPVNEKTFPAGVFADGTHLPTEETVSGATMVLISEPVVWEVEFRCLVLDRAVVTLSPYLRYCELAQSEDGRWQDARTEQARDFAQQMIADNTVNLPSAVVVDVGIITERGWAVVEANAAWCSGMYGCDPAEVLRVVHRACSPDTY
jgi:hypothetical protein